MPLTFLQPTSRVFHFDEVCGQIVRALEGHEWKFPGMEVTFHTYGFAGHDYRRVDIVEGRDFRLSFGRIQGELGPLNDTAAINTMNIPERELMVFSDTSGSRLRVYVGEDWAADRVAFMRGSVLDARTNRLPRTELVYSGQSLKATFLKPYSPSARNYLPEGDEPRQYLTTQVHNEFTQWLRKNVLAKLQGA